MRAAVTAVLLLTVAVALVACGNERPTITELVARASPDTKELRYQGVGLSLSLPENVEVREAVPPGVFRASLGGAVVSAYAYRRREELPRTDAQLEKARERLEREAGKRSDAFRLVRSRATKVAGARAVELLGDQTVSQARLRIRSLHLYEGKAEYVIELLAPRAEFERFDRALSPLIRRTLEVTGRVRRNED